MCCNAFGLAAGLIDPHSERAPPRLEISVFAIAGVKGRFRGFQRRGGLRHCSGGSIAPISLRGFALTQVFFLAVKGCDGFIGVTEQGFLAGEIPFKLADLAIEAM